MLMMQGNNHLTGFGQKEDDMQRPLPTNNEEGGHEIQNNMSFDVYEALNQMGLARNSLSEMNAPHHARSALSRGNQLLATAGRLSDTTVERRPMSSTDLDRIHRGLGVPDLYMGPNGSSSQSRSVVSRDSSAAILATNTSPNTHVLLDRMMPSPSVRKLDSSMRYLLKMSGQSVEKRGSQSELDMNLPFPVKLHYILSNPKYRDCVAWLPHGRAWRILKAKTFEKKVIPKFFRSAKYASFMRQVNGWAFTRITEGPDLNAYYHEMFLRGLPNLSFKMKRPPKVKSAAAAARNAAGAGAGTPDFYRIEKIAPLPPAQPFRPVAQESKIEGDGPRYEIEPLEPEAENDALEEMPMMVWSTNTEPQEAITSLPFADPFDEDSSSPNGPKRKGGATKGSRSIDASTGSQAIQDDLTSKTIGASTSVEEDKAHNGEKDQQSTTRDERIHGDKDNKEEDDNDADSIKLSKADITYLAHQNQILLLHAENASNKDDKTETKDF